MLYGLNFAGGKAGVGSRTIGSWIKNQLPMRRLYAEPFAGMLGVLLKRPRAKIEIVNDTNGRLVNWWKCLRDEPDELLRLMAFTPYSRDAYAEAIEQLDDRELSDVRRAAAFSAVLRQAYGATDVDATRGRWLLSMQASRGQTEPLIARLIEVADRINNVQIENRDAVQLLDRLSDIEEAVIYCDPPYQSADRRAYADEPDFSALTDSLLAQSGLVAVSGYADEWDHLGWRRETFATYCNTAQRYGFDTARQEMLWMNYPPLGQQSFDSVAEKDAADQAEYGSFWRRGWV